MQQAKILEAADIIEILKKSFVYRTGGRDVDGRQIIEVHCTIQQMQTINFDDLSAVIKYLIYMHDKENHPEGSFIVIIDSRKNIDKNLDLIVSSFQSIIGDKLKKVILVKDDIVLDKSKIFVNLKKEKSSEISEILTLHKLFKIVSRSQLTAIFGGSFTYNHDHWLQVRLLFEQFLKENKSTIRYMDTTLIKMQENLQIVTQVKIEDILNQNSKLFNSAKDTLDIHKQKGIKLIKELETDGDSGFRCTSDLPQNPDITDALMQVKMIILNLEHCFQHLSESSANIDRQLKQMHEFHCIEKKIQEVINWILGPAEDLLMLQQMIGDDYSSADSLRKQHEQLEMKCIGSYSQYAELRHDAEIFIKQNHPSSKEMEILRDYMDTICRSFAFRLERRRNHLIASSHFHRSVQEVNQKFLNLNDVLQEKWDSNNPWKCQQSLFDAANIYENFVNITEQAICEGEYLLDMLKMPIKNSIGLDISPDFTPTIQHIEKLLEQIKQKKKHSRESIELRQLRLQQILQLYDCEKEAKQALEWIKELCILLMTDQHNLPTDTDYEEMESIIHDLELLEKTVKNTYDYGRKLLHTALILRRSCKLSFAVNIELGHQLHSLHEKFLLGCKEKTSRLISCETFLHELNKILQNIHINSKGVSNDPYIKSVLRTDISEEIIKLQKTIEKGYVLLQRLSIPLFPGLVAGKTIQDEGALEEIRKKITEGETVLADQDASRRDSLRSYTSSSSSLIMNSFKSAASSLIEDWKTATSSMSEDWRTAPSDLTSGEESNMGDEYFSAEENLSDNGMKSIPETENIEEKTPPLCKPVFSKQTKIHHTEIIKETQTLISGTHLKNITELQQNGKMSMTTETAVSSTAFLERSVNTAVSPLMTSTPLPIIENFQNQNYESVDADPLIKHTKEVGEYICEMIRSIILK